MKSSLRVFAAPMGRRAAAIRDDLARMDKDPVVSKQYAVIAAQWEALRLAQHKGKTIPIDDSRLRELGAILEPLSDKLGLGRELTDARGFLVGDSSRIICSSWQEAAGGW